MAGSIATSRPSVANPDRETPTSVVRGPAPGTRARIGQGEKIMAVKRRALSPLDRSDEIDHPGPQGLASTDDVDRGAVVLRPVRAGNARVAKHGVGKHPLDRLANERLDRPTSVLAPTFEHPRGGKVAPPPGDHLGPGLDETQPEAQVRIGDRVAGELRRRWLGVGRDARQVDSSPVDSSHVESTSGDWVQIEKLTPKEPPVKVTTALAQELRRDAPVI